MHGTVLSKIISNLYPSKNSDQDLNLVTDTASLNH